MYKRYKNYYHTAESTNLMSDSRSRVSGGRGRGCGQSTVNFFSSMFTAVTTMKPGKIILVKKDLGVIGIQKIITFAFGKSVQS